MFCYSLTQNTQGEQEVNLSKRNPSNKQTVAQDEGLKLPKTGGRKAVVKLRVSGSLASGEAHLCIPVHHFILLNHLPADLAAMIHNSIHLRPRPEFSLPISDGGKRGNDEKRTMDSPDEYF